MNARKWEPLFISFIAISMFIISILPMGLKALAPKAGQTYIPIHNSLSDYPYYTSIIKQGIDGQLLVVDRMTSEPQAGGVVHIFYLALGWIGRVFGMTDANMVYHLARFIFAAVWMIVMYRFIRWFITTPRARIIAFFFAVCSAGFPVFDEWRGVRFLVWPMGWWTEFDPMKRAVFLPHYLVGHILMALALIWWMEFQKNGNIKKMILASITSLLAAIIHPPSYMYIVLLIPLWFILTRSWKRLPFMCIGIGIGVFPILLYTFQYKIFPWTLAQAYENQSYYIPFLDHVLSLGPVLPLAIVGFISKRTKKETWILVLWAAFAFFLPHIVWYLLGTPFLPWIHISNVRFLQTAVWLPLAVGAAWALEIIGARAGKIALTLTFIFIAALTFVGYPNSFIADRQKVYGAVEFMYPEISYIDAIKSLRTFTKEGNVILSLPMAGQIIPSYTNRTIYVGNEEYYTKDVSSKMDAAWAFYSGISPCTAFKFATDNRISTVFYSFDEITAGNAVYSYPFLTKAAQFGKTVVFTVNNTFAGCQ